MSTEIDWKMRAWIRPVLSENQMTSFVVCLTNSTITSEAQLLGLLSPQTKQSTIQEVYGTRYRLYMGDAFNVVGDT